MLVRVTGSKDKEFSKILKNACNFYTNYFLSKRLSQHLSVFINLKKKLEDNAEGYCNISGLNKQGFPRKFYIEVVANRPRKDTLEILAHEMVHVKQYALSELNMAEMEDERHLWRGRFMSRNLEYWDYPWEKEARKYEIKLAAKFIETYKIDLL